MENEYSSNLFQNCTIRGLPITAPFRIHYDVQGKDSEIGTFIILPFQVNNSKVKLIDFTNNSEMQSETNAVHDSSHGDLGNSEDADDQEPKITIKVEPQDNDTGDICNMSHFNERAAHVNYSQLFDFQFVSKKKRMVKNTPRVRYKRKKDIKYCETNENLEDDIDHEMIKVKKRKTSERDPELEELQKPKLVKLEQHGDDDDSEGSHRKSSRLQHAGYRPDYKNVENKIDNVLKYLEGDDVISNMEEDQLHEDSDTVEETPSCDNNVTNIKADFKRNKSSQKQNKSEDPDFDPSMLYSNKVCSKKESVDIDNEVSENEYSNESDSDEVNEGNSKCDDQKKSSKKADDKKKKPPVSKLLVKRIFVKLEEHPDKYKIEQLENLKRKDRGKSDLERFVTVYVCTVCNQFNSESVEGMEGHLEHHLNGDLTCAECDFFSTNVAEVVLHKAQTHTKDRRICPECGVTVCYGGLKTHYGLVHNDPQYICEYCQKNESIVVKFTTCNLLRKHLRMSHRDTCLVCEICDKVFIKEDHFKLHLTRCNGKKDKTRQCEKCGNKFASEPNLLRHVERVHLKVRKYLCTECPFAAKSPSVLRNHKFVHQGVHPFQCDQCSFTCVQAYQLVSHMRTHTGEKPYKCTQCKYAAAWNVQLKEHVKVHSMATAVPCPICEIMFKNEKTRNIHMKKQKCVA